MTGAALCIANLTKVFKAMTDEAMDTTREWAEDTMTISQENFCPYKTGKLKSTGKVKTVTGTTRLYKVRLSYGEGINYALAVHELPYNHYNPPNAQWKFLSTPFNMRTPSLIQDLQNRCSDVV